MGLFDDFSFGKDLLGPLLSAGVKTFGDIYSQNDAAALANEQLDKKWAHDDAIRQQDTLLQLQLEALKAQYGGGGGGSPGNRAALTQAQRLGAKQNAQAGTMNAINNLLSFYGGLR